VHHHHRSTDLSNRQLAQDMVNRITEALRTAPPGVELIRVDGIETRYNRTDLTLELQEWERRLTRASGRRPFVSTINLSASF
jgi:hypothetical protein